jgi:hypothetical protein
MKRTIYGAAILSALFLSGCTNSGAFLAANQTQVNLSQANYTLTATNISGEAMSAYVLGASFGTGFTVNTLAIARIKGTGMLYKEALGNLWTNYEADHGTINRKRLALTNIRYDTDILNLIIYTKVTVGVRADVVEFTN